jgi:hypothetical protein
MSNESLDRGNSTKFMQYMKENPYYFEGVIGKPFSEEAVEKTIKELQLFGFIGVVKKESIEVPVVIPPRKRIKKLCAGPSPKRK